MKKKEGYKRSCLANDCQIQRTPVDYSFEFGNIENHHIKSPDKWWSNNPHYQADPGNKYQPLYYGHIDLDREIRRLNENKGILFQQYRNDYKGCGGSQFYPNDEKTRFDVTNVGDVSLRRDLDNAYSTSFGMPGFTNTESDRLLKDPYPQDHNIYMGTPDQYGD